MGFSHKLAQRALEAKGLSRIPAVLKSVLVAFLKMSLVRFPPCSRQRPSDIAGAWHGLSFRVCAPQRGAWRMCKSMGLISDNSAEPLPRGGLDHSHQRLPAVCTWTCSTVTFC